MSRSSLVTNPLNSFEYLSNLISLEDALLNNAYSLRTIQNLVSMYTVP